MRCSSAFSTCAQGTAWLAGACVPLTPGRTPGAHKDVQRVHPWQLAVGRHCVPTTKNKPGGCTPGMAPPRPPLGVWPPLRFPPLRVLPASLPAPACPAESQGCAPPALGQGGTWSAAAASQTRAAGCVRPSMSRSAQRAGRPSQRTACTPSLASHASPSGSLRMGAHANERGRLASAKSDSTSAASSRKH